MIIPLSLIVSIATACSSRCERRVSPPTLPPVPVSNTSRPNSATGSIERNAMVRLPLITPVISTTNTFSPLSVHHNEQEQCQQITAEVDEDEEKRQQRQKRQEEMIREFNEEEEEEEEKNEEEEEQRKNLFKDLSLMTYKEAEAQNYGPDWLLMEEDRKRQQRQKEYERIICRDRLRYLAEKPENRKLFARIRNSGPGIDGCDSSRSNDDATMIGQRTRLPLFVYSSRTKPTHSKKMPKTINEDGSYGDYGLIELLRGQRAGADDDDADTVEASTSSE